MFSLFFLVIFYYLSFLLLLENIQSVQNFVHGVQEFFSFNATILGTSHQSVNIISKTQKHVFFLPKTFPFQNSFGALKEEEEEGIRIKGTEPMNIFTQTLASSIIKNLQKKKQKNYREEPEQQSRNLQIPTQINSRIKTKPFFLLTTLQYYMQPHHYNTRKTTTKTYTKFFTKHPARNSQTHEAIHNTTYTEKTINNLQSK